MENFSIMTRENSLVAIKGWDFMPNDDGKITAIPLTMPKNLTADELGAMVCGSSHPVIVDGDVRPGTASFLVFSESLARKLIESHGCYFIKEKAFIDAAAL